MRKKKLELLDMAPRCRKKHKAWEFRVHKELAAGEEILVIDIFYSMNEDVTYRVFLGQTDYETLIKTGGRPGWTHKNLKELLRMEYVREGNHWRYGSREEILIAGEERELLSGYTGIQKSGPENCIIQYQEKKNELKRAARNKRETDRWDEELGVLPPLPADWQEFIHKEAVIENYIFYRRETRDRGICTYCEKEVPLPYARHNLMTRCPRCGKYVRLKDLSGSMGSWADRRKAWLIQRDGSRLLVSGYRIYKCYRMEHENKKITAGYRPEELIIMNLQGKPMSQWEWGPYKNRYQERWNRLKMRYWEGQGCLYHGNADDWQEFLANKYLPVKDIPYETDLFPGHLLQGEKDRLEAAEKIMKIGLWYLAGEVMNGRLPAEKRINRILKIENDDLEIFKSVNPDWRQYQFFQLLKKYGKRPDAEEMEQYVCTDIPLTTIEKLIPYTTFHQIYRRYRFNSGKIIKNYYHDYYNMCKELKFDMKSTFVLFPKNIKKAHDDLVLYYNEKKDEEEGRERNRIYAKVAEMAAGLNELYGVEDKKYFIRAPRDAAEIIREGHAMHHCVAGKSYTENMAKGRSYILFIRKKTEPEKSWYTLEMRSDHTVVQVRGFANGDKDNIRQKSIWKLLTARLKELKEKERIKAVAG